MIKIRIGSAGQSGTHGRVEKFIHIFGRKLKERSHLGDGGGDNIKTHGQDSCG